MNGYNGEFRMVNPKEVVIDQRYQRTKKNALIQQIAQSPSWEAFGAPTCFERSNGMLYAADGQQRIAGMLASNNPPRLIPVLVFPMETVEEEAQVFTRINEWRKQLQPIEKHKSKVVAKEPAALAVERAVAQAGFSIGVGLSKADNPRTIQAVASVNWIYNRIGEEKLVQTLTCIKTAWPEDGTGISTHILRGVAVLIEEKGDAYNRAKLVTALRRTEPHLVLRKASEMKLDFGGSKADNVRRAFAVLSGLKIPKEQMPKITK